MDNHKSIRRLGTTVMPRGKSETVTRSRGLITFTERDRISGKEDVENARRYQAVSRVRRRINEELPEEIALLEEHHPELLEEFREIVCDWDNTDVHDTNESGSDD